MRDPAPQAIRLADYRPPAWLVDDVQLRFRLDPDATRVVSRIALRPGEGGPAPLALDGEGLRLLWAKVDGEPVEPQVGPHGLTLDRPARSCVWECEVELAPAANTALEGLYMSNGMYCTQCEPEGFRRITYYPDRPDVMARFAVRIESDLPVLLSNGERVAAGEGWAEWRDPWPKPSYLFALVAGDLRAHRDRFTTMSGRGVDLAVWTRPGPDEAKCAFAMDALIRSMRWDEEAYGREYDLPVFNVVAVSDFNMGAMENKGLNIFNSSAVLASPETATDADFERIEAIVAHEYFHNWTGNRITCRDWFQLCLKEGLTVFRDQQFTAHERSAAVARIRDVAALRARQFREDAGPLAHPVRPESFVEINNFYTATVYEKGAEVVGMLRTLVGSEGYDAALALYFERQDGQACTVEDWLRVFEDATGRDLSRFARWYSQAGTPRIRVTECWDEPEDGRGGTYTLTLAQRTPPTPGRAEKAPLVVPVAVGLLDPSGEEVVPTRVLELDREEASFRFEGLARRPIPSLLRGFSAPVVLERDAPEEERAFLLAHDTDPFARWEAGRQLGRAALIRMVEGEAPDPRLLDALAAVAGADLDPAFRALCLAPPGEDELAQAIHEAGATPDPDAIHAAREALLTALARRLADLLPRLLEEGTVPGPYDPGAGPAGRRSLGQAALSLLARIDGGAAARERFAAASNMTEEVGALSALLSVGEGREEAERFHARWRGDALVTDKWFALLVARAAPSEAAATAARLTEHPDFDLRPNRVRAVLGTLGAHPAGFHAADGAGYALLADWTIRLDRTNPQLAARGLGAFETWRRYDPERRARAEAALDRIAEGPNLSRDCREKVERMRG